MQSTTATKKEYYFLTVFSCLKLSKNDAAVLLFASQLNPETAQ